MFANLTKGSCIYVLDMRNTPKYDMATLHDAPQHYLRAPGNFPPTQPHASFPVQELLWTRPLGCVAAPHDDAQLLSVLKTFWQYHGQDATFFIVETRRQLLHIRHEEILYFESRGKSVYPHTLSGAAESFPARLDVVAARLAPYRYVRCHQSYLANLRHVRQLNKVTHQLTLSSGATIPISKQYYAQVIECLRADRA